MKRCEAARDLTGTLAPHCVDGPWASPRAGGPRRPLLSCCDEMPGASILSGAAARQTSGTIVAHTQEQDLKKKKKKKQPQATKAAPI